MEAMHSRTCVVAYDIGSTRDVIIDGETGVLLSEDQLPGLCDVIANLLADDARRQELADGAFPLRAEKHLVLGRADRGGSGAAVRISGPKAAGCAALGGANDKSRGTRR